MSSLKKKKNWYKWTYLQNRNSVTDLKKTNKQLWLPRAKGRGTTLEIVVNIYTLLLLSASVMSDSVQPNRQQSTRLPHPWDPPGNNTGVGCHFLLQCMKVKSEREVTQPCPTLSDPMDCSLPGSSIHGNFQARILEWAAIAFSDIYTSVYKTES